jgi:hypothetical protein
MAKPTKVKYDDSDDDSCDDDGCRSDDDDENYSKDYLMDIIDQMSKRYKRLYKKSKIFEKELIAKSNENKALMKELVTDQHDYTRLSKKIFHRGR